MSAQPGIDADVPPDGVGGGAGGQTVDPVGAVVLAPVPRVSQPSTGHVWGRTVRVDSEAIEPRSTSDQMAGVEAGEMSVHLRPGIPTTTTGCPGALAERALAAEVPTSRSGRAMRARRAVRITRARRRVCPLSRPVKILSHSVQHAFGP